MTLRSERRPHLLIHLPEEITGPWLAEVLGRRELEVLSVAAIPLGPMSQGHRVTFAAPEGAGAVVVELASPDLSTRSRAAMLGAYARQVTFYQELGPRIDGPVAGCHLAEHDVAAGWLTIVLDDFESAHRADPLSGCTLAEAEVALRGLAGVHAPFIDDPVLPGHEVLNKPSPLGQALLTGLLPGFLDRYGDRVAPEHAEVCRSFVSSFDAWAAQTRAPLGLLHGDYRWENILYGEDGCTVVGWHATTWGPLLRDVASFTSSSLDSTLRRVHEEELVRLYHSELVARGAAGLSFESCWTEYRRASFVTLPITIAAAMMTERTDPGDRMFLTSLSRACQQVLDLDAVALLPRSEEALVPLHPTVEDEGRHDVGPEPLWSESWYFDAVSDDGALGVYVRLGRVVNQGDALYTAAIVGPGRPAVLVVDQAAPLPTDALETVRTAAFTATQECVTPLETFELTLRGAGAAFQDEAGPLRAEAGTAVEVAFDLRWNTDGVPFKWRQTERYELPCRVEGSVRIGEEEIPFTGVGQRDHSHGDRDWWGHEWMWSAFHFEDGTRTHMVTIEGLTGMAFGYVQKDGQLTELTSGTSEATRGEDGSFTAATLRTDDAPLTIHVRPVARGNVRLVSKEGKVSHFHRAMASATTADGRRGTGWIEWNRIQTGP